MEQTRQVPEHLKNKNFPVNPEGEGASARRADWAKRRKQSPAPPLQSSFSSLPSVEIFRHASIRGGDWSRRTGFAFSATDSFFPHNFCAAICSRGAHCGRERLAVVESFCSGCRLHGVRAYRSDAF